MEPITLTNIGKYKDGGSLSFKDKQGNKYWQCFKFGDHNKYRYGKLFKGDINDPNPQLAEGTFILGEVTKLVKKSQIITQ